MRCLIYATAVALPMWGFMYCLYAAAAAYAN